MSILAHRLPRNLITSAVNAKNYACSFTARTADFHPRLVTAAY
jgi:hypothetical protein